MCIWVYHRHKSPMSFETGMSQLHSLRSLPITISWLHELHRRPFVTSQSPLSPTHEKCVHLFPLLLRMRLLPLSFRFFGFLRLHFCCIPFLPLVAMEVIIPNGAILRSTQQVSASTRTSLQQWTLVSTLSSHDSRLRHMHNHYCMVIHTDTGTKVQNMWRLPVPYWIRHGERKLHHPLNLNIYTHSMVFDRRLRVGCRQWKHWHLIILTDFLIYHM